MSAARLGSRLALGRALAAALALAACDKHHNVTAASPPGTPSPPPSGPPVSGDVCSGASPYTLAGYHWAGAAAAYEYGANLPSGWRSSVDAAAGTWNGAGSRLRISHDPATGGGARPCWLLWEARQIALTDGDNVVGRGEDVAVWIDAPGVSRRGHRGRPPPLRARRGPRRRAPPPGRDR